ncbi:NUDIX hydrolase [Ekhidna sp.]
MKIIITCLLGLFALNANCQDENLVAAGVLPYTVINDTVYVLLGYDADKPGWTDFGGGREMVASLEDEQRLETPQEIAVREFFEECRMVYGREEIDLNFRPDAYIEAVNGVYRSYVVNIPYKSRQKIRQAMIPLDDKFIIFREKSDFYWIPLEELKSIIRSGGNSLPNSPNNGVIYKHFYNTLNKVLQDDQVDGLFLK